MPYADRENALLVGTPSQFSPETESTVVQVQGDSFTGDPLKDAIAESLDYFLLFRRSPAARGNSRSHRSQK